MAMAFRRIIIEIGALTDPDRDDYTRFLPTEASASLPDGVRYPAQPRHVICFNLMYSPRFAWGAARTASFLVRSL